MQFKIGNKLIGNNLPCFIIAEAGVNHNGNIEKAKKLIDIAKDAGVDAIKFQTWITEEIVTKKLSKAKYQMKNTGKKDSQFNMLKRLELSFDQFAELKNYADKKEIIFLSTPDDEISADFLESLGVPAYKMGSGELTNTLMLKKIGQKNKPIILSTGMATIEEIKESIDVIYNTGNKKLILLHCTSQYPTNLKDVNLKAMVKLKNTFNTIIGYSDHTLGTLVPQLAVALGAKVIEKHFTYDINAEGPDHICSLNPLELKEMVESIRTTELILGKELKEPISQELELRKFVRKFIVSKKDISKGTTITEEMLTLKRSNGDLTSKEMKNIIGWVSLKNIKKDQPINMNDLEEK